MSHLPLSLMNRLNQTVSADFKLWVLYFRMISFQIIMSTLGIQYVPNSVSYIIIIKCIKFNHDYSFYVAAYWV